MRIAISLLAVAGLAAVVAMAVVLLYRTVYQRQINRKLNGELSSSGRLLSPWSFFLAAAFAVLLLLVGFATFLAVRGGGERVPEEYMNAVYDYHAYSPDQMEGYRAAYSIESNAGYTKQVEQRGEVRFTYFLREDSFDFYHPSFIVYIEYTGERDILYYGVEGNFFAPSGTLMGGRGSAGSPYEGYFCVVGTSTVAAELEVSAYFYDNELKGEQLGDYATVAETLNFTVPGR